MRLSPLLTKLALLCISFSSAEVWSHAKTDIVTVANGDQITGAVNAMTAGKLSLRTDYAGTVNIKWREVKQIESRYVYEVRLDDGERIYGRFVPSGVPEQLAFRSGRVNRQFDIDDIVEVRSIEEELSDKLDFSIGATVYADPNTQTLVLNARGQYDVRGGRTTFQASINDTRTSIKSSAEETPCDCSENPDGGTVDEPEALVNKDTESSNASSFEISREFWRERGTAQSYRVLNARYETNDELGIAHRGSLGFGLGRYLINDLGHELAISGGVQGVQERRKTCDDQTGKQRGTLYEADDERQTCNDAELFLNVKWHLYSFQNLDMDISLNGNTYPSLSDWGRVRGDLKLLINWELFDSFYWTVDAQTIVDSAGDRDDTSLSNSDYTISTGVTWRY
ncbi:MAG: DUF481 domain-containing protein [Proteobacteria bacterium]|nr:DUF481 domain-containing protein [Pseudomonadota bacterium]